MNPTVLVFNSSNRIDSDLLYSFQTGCWFCLLCGLFQNLGCSFGRLFVLLLFVFFNSFVVLFSLFFSVKKVINQSIEKTSPAHFFCDTESLLEALVKWCNKNLI